MHSFRRIVLYLKLIRCLFSCTTISWGCQKELFVLSSYFVLSSSVPNAVTLQLKSSNARSITVSWADPGGVQDYFEVDCGSDSSTPVQRIYPNDTCEATCAINDASIDHTIRVTAVSGDKRNSTEGIFTPGGKCVICFWYLLNFLQHIARKDVTVLLKFETIHNRY